MGLAALLLDPLLSRPIISLALLSISLVASLSLYRVFLHPLSVVPGPLISKCTSLPLYWQSYIGSECTFIHTLHAKYGPVVRIGPNDLDIADGALINTVYVERGGFLKSQCYENFHIDEHPTIFSALDPSHRAPRAKAVVAMFSTSSIRAGSDVLYSCVDRWVARMKEEAASGKPVNVLNLTRSLATDAVTAYLFDENYGGLDESGGQLSSSPFVDAFVAVGRFFYLPHWLFLFLERVIGTDEHSEMSMRKVDAYVAGLVEGSEKKDNYPGRLLRAGFSPSETCAQCKDLIFAGTDSTGMNLASICWYLAQNPSIYEQLQKEVEANQIARLDIQALPYLRGVIREGLRLSMANPTRLPRVVPPSGFTYPPYCIPAGMNVGVAAFELHLNPAIFPEPEKFLPERWMDASEEMGRDWIPFGMGSRACIARNLATVELFMAVEKIAESGLLAGARTMEGEGARIEIMEWFNSKVKGERIELVWAAKT